MKDGQPASFWTVFHVMSNLPTDPAASVIGRQLAICQHLGVKEVVLQQNIGEREQMFKMRNQDQFPQDKEHTELIYL